MLGETILSLILSKWIHEKCDVDKEFPCGFDGSIIDGKYRRSFKE
jgi:hypothetical protein